MLERFTGNTRLRIHRCVGNGGEEVLLVLQVEVGAHNSPITSWRDAKVEDITITNSPVKTIVGWYQEAPRP